MVDAPAPSRPAGPDPGTTAALAVGLIVFFTGLAVIRAILRRTSSKASWAKHAVAEGAERFMDTGRPW